MTEKRKRMNKGGLVNIVWMPIGAWPHYGSSYFLLDRIHCHQWRHAPIGLQRKVGGRYPQAPLKPKKSKVPWTEEEGIKLLQVWNEGRSWEYIFAALPSRSEGTIRVRCSTKFKKRLRTGPGRSWTGGGTTCFIDLGPPVSEKSGVGISG
jgi:hypothetical protein